jgi:hypothetical protein
VAAFLAAGQAALAQSPECQRFRAELANLQRSGGGAPTRAMQAQRAEINRLVGYYRSIGCERGPLGFLTGPAPAECGSIAQQIRQLEAGYGRLASQAVDPGEIEVRRRQLQAAVQQTCSTEQPRGFFESLFGAPRSQQPVEQQQQQIAPEGQPVVTQEPSLGGGRLICVRTCDGSFFPLTTPPGGQQSADEMCQALCPGTEAVAFAYPGGDEGLNRAASLAGNKPYTSLANAFKFRKSFDESCACKKPDESWAVVLRKAESMLAQRKGDVIVTAEQAEEMSRPKAAQARKAADKKADEEEKAAAEIAAAAPTASRESSGIGPQSIENTTVVSQGEGATREIADGAGHKKTVRIIAPNVIPAPNVQN